MAVKGRQAESRGSSRHDVSCDLSILYSQVLWAHQIEYDQKYVNGETDDVNGVARIWCKEAWNEASTAKTETTGRHGGQSSHGP